MVAALASLASATLPASAAAQTASAAADHNVPATRTWPLRARVVASGLKQADKIAQGQATGAEWRTTPLIGTRLRDRYLHDGRATSLRDPVLEHGGEGEIVRKRFFELDEDEQRAVYAFVARL
ncbi:di-heme oxidoredictase family protein [Roseateles sp.]|uniref:di-heme oxidoredictase family protein n=1 Tax=Roseateles sp. TaxID=1971397 RepID=UPI003264230C